MSDEAATRKMVSKAVAILRHSQHLSDELVHREMINEGISPYVAGHLVEFLPMAYARLILRRSGARFSNSFQCLRPDGSFEERALSTEPLWTVAVAFAETEAVHGVSASELLAVATRSAELHAANQLLNQGSSLQNVVLTPAVLTWLQEPTKG